MEKNLIRLIDRVNDGKMWSPEDALKEALRDIQKGKRKSSKIMVITLDQEGDAYRPGYYQAGMSNTEMLALLEMMKFAIARMIAGEDD